MQIPLQLTFISSEITLLNCDIVLLWQCFYRNNYVFWSDVNADVIYRGSLDGTGERFSVVDSYISAVGKSLKSV